MESIPAIGSLMDLAPMVQLSDQDTAPIPEESSKNHKTKTESDEAQDSPPLLLLEVPQFEEHSSEIGEVAPPKSAPKSPKSKGSPSASPRSPKESKRTPSPSSASKGKHSKSRKSPSADGKHSKTKNDAAADPCPLPTPADPAEAGQPQQPEPEGPKAENVEVEVSKEGIEPTEPQAIQSYKRPGGQRRMSFRVEATPQIVNADEQAMKDLIQLCGEDIINDTDASADEQIDWEGCEPSYGPPAREITKEEFDAIFLSELDKANDETDCLFGKDDIDMPTKNNTQETEEKATETGAPALDTSALRIWYMKLKRSHMKDVKVAKVGKNTDKRFKNIRLTNESLILSNSNETARREIHLSSIKEVKMGYASDELRLLLDLTPIAQPFPPPVLCAVLILPRRSLSLLFPSEVSRNGFVFLLRVEMRAVKLAHGDRDSPAGGEPENLPL